MRIADLVFLSWAYGWKTNDELIIGNVQFSKLSLRLSSSSAIPLRSREPQEFSVA